MLYLWIKGWHIIGVVCWFAALFYLPRLFVYHAQSTDKLSHERFVIMERRLYRGIMWPSGIATTGLGLWMLHLNPGLLQQKWMHIKLGLILLLWIYHLFCGYYRKRLIETPDLKSHVFFRFFNEGPTLLLIAIVLLAVLKLPQ